MENIDYRGEMTEIKKTVISPPVISPPVISPPVISPLWDNFTPCDYSCHVVRSCDVEMTEHRFGQMITILCKNRGFLPIK